MGAHPTTWYQAWPNSQHRAPFRNSHMSASRWFYIINWIASWCMRFFTCASDPCMYTERILSPWASESNRPVVRECCRLLQQFEGVEVFCMVLRVLKNNSVESICASESNRLVVWERCTLLQRLEGVAVCYKVLRALKILIPSTSVHPSRIDLCWESVASCCRG